MPLTEFDYRKAVGLLWKHAASHDHIRPIEVRFGELLGIAVYEPNIPVRWQQGGDGYEAERRGRVARAHEFARFRKIPECFRSELRINQKYAAGMLLPHHTPQAVAL